MIAAMTDLNGLDGGGGGGDPKADHGAAGSAGIAGQNGVSGQNGGDKRLQYGHIKLDISNSVLPLEKLDKTPSSKDGLAEEAEIQIRNLSCELIQLAGKLLKLPQVFHTYSVK